jgi:hypothetical protein
VPDGEARLRWLRRRVEARRYRTTLGERDVTGLVESMKPRCRFRRRREVAARAVARKTALFFGARPYTGRHPAEG